MISNSCYYYAKYNTAAKFPLNSLRGLPKELSPTFKCSFTEVYTHVFPQSYEIHVNHYMQVANLKIPSFLLKGLSAT
jgi:hypothetical protein